ncbi:serine hydroxymethyltransferase [Photorhabdus sp. RM323S]|uniref:serine hydroxymethyltransferase n=1 Tax=Photorhabdus sp. RM323S TaxID=3342828 RepID=UPI0036DEA163
MINYISQQQSSCLLESEDPLLNSLINKESKRQKNALSMVASASVALPSVIACENTTLINVTTEGYPNSRYHGGCRFVDQIEELAVERAKSAFSAKYANVQPHSGSSSNEIVIFGLLNPGDRILGMDICSGGHLTHGAPVSAIAKYFEVYSYGVDPKGYIDYEQIEDIALHCKPKLIICGASSYPRKIDFAKFRKIADKLNAFLLADISHIAGLVASGLHMSPIDHAHITTTSTYKQLYGPRGGLILCGKDYDICVEKNVTLSQKLQKAVFPFYQGTPILNAIAGKARALDFVNSKEFALLMKNVILHSNTLANNLIELGYNVITQGTDNHMVLVNLLDRGITGYCAEKSLEKCNIIVNRNRIAGDNKSSMIASGLRFGTNSLAFRGLGQPELKQCTEIINEILTHTTVISDTQFRLDENIKNKAVNQVKALCDQFPLYHV